MARLVPVELVGQTDGADVWVKEKICPFDRWKKHSGEAVGANGVFCLRCGVVLP